MLTFKQFLDKEMSTDIVVIKHDLPNTITVKTPIDFNYGIGYNEAIKELSYYKWENAGRPEGRSEEFWVEAEKEYFSTAPYYTVPYMIHIDESSFPHYTSSLY